MEQFIQINTDCIDHKSHIENDLFQTRQDIERVYAQYAAAEVSIVVVGFNRLEKTKRCIESILKYTADIDYELILVDSGSSDGTLEYFRSVEYPKKKVIALTKNIGVAYAFSCFSPDTLGNYVCIVTNDLIVTKNWLSNLLTCIKSDPKIGMVNPATNNVSNAQNIDFEYQSYDEMQQKAAELNKSDPKKWEDRLRLIVLGSLIRKEAILAKGWPLLDVGFYHDYVDDDISFAIRRLGYRLVFAGDTWICHDHKAFQLENKNIEEYKRSLAVGKKNFGSKYFGVNTDDTFNMYFQFAKKFPVISNERNAVKILGVDVLCGTPVLDIKNYLRKNSVFETEISAFTCDAKYYVDLKSICGGKVVCDRIEHLNRYFPSEQFDYVICDRPLNTYPDPQSVMSDLFSVCKSGGVVSLKLKNTYSYYEYVHMLGRFDSFNENLSYLLPLNAVVAAVNSKFGPVKHYLNIAFGLPQEAHQVLESLIPPGIPAEDKNEILRRMETEEYLIIAQKK